MKGLLRLAIRATVATATLAVLFHFVPFRAVAASLGGLDPWYLLAAMVLQYVPRVIATVRMKVITDSQGIRLGHGSLFRVLLAAQFYSMVLPGPVGGGAATWVKYVQAGADRRGAVVAIVLNRVVSLLVMATIGAFALFVDLERAHTEATVAAVALGVILLGLVNVRWSAHALAPEVRGNSRIRQHVRELVDRLLLYGRIPTRDKGVVLLASVLFELTGAAVMWLFAMAAGLRLSLLTVLWIRGALMILLMLPISIAGLGIREAGLVGLCALVGVPATAAVTWSLTMLFGLVVVAATGGLLESGGLANRVLRLGGRLRGLSTTPAGEASSGELRDAERR